MAYKMTCGSYLTSYHILLVESEGAFRQEMALALRGDNFVVTGVADYLEALGKLVEFNTDMVLLDKDLPMVDSWEACHQIRGMLGIPVILLGYDSGDEVWAELIQARADFYLKRPFTALELVARVRAILRRYHRYETRSHLN